MSGTEQDERERSEDRGRRWDAGGREKGAVRCSVLLLLLLAGDSLAIDARWGSGVRRSGGSRELSILAAGGTPASGISGGCARRNRCLARLCRLGVVHRHRPDCARRSPGPSWCGTDRAGGYLLGHAAAHSRCGVHHRLGEVTNGRSGALRWSTARRRELGAGRCQAALAGCIQEKSRVVRWMEQRSGW